MPLPAPSQARSPHHSRTGIKSTTGFESSRTHGGCLALLRSRAFFWPPLSRPHEHKDRKVEVEQGILNQQTGRRALCGAPLPGTGYLLPSRGADPSCSSSILRPPCFRRKRGGLGHCPMSTRYIGRSQALTARTRQNTGGIVARLMPEFASQGSGWHPFYRGNERQLYNRVHEPLQATFSQV